MTDHVRRTAWNDGRRNGRGSAFTLVEILVTMTISTVILLAAHAAFVKGREVWRHLEDGAPEADHASFLLDTLRRELGGLYLPPTEGEAPFVGSYNEETGERRLTFFTTDGFYRPGQLRGWCNRVTYEFRLSDVGEAPRWVLIRRQQPYAGEKAIGETIAEVVTDELASLQLLYFNEAAETEDRRWLPRFSASRRPPPAIRVRMWWRGGGQFETILTVPCEGALFPLSGEEGGG